MGWSKAYTILAVRIQLAQSMPMNGSAVVLELVANSDSEGVTCTIVSLSHAA